MTTVLIVDDQALQRLGFSMLLEQHPDLTVVGEATHGAEAVRMTAELRPDVVLMDVRMPGMDGIEATRRIVESGGRSRVLVLTTFDLDEYAYAALRAGASGFLLKDALPDELVGRHPRGGRRRRGHRPRPDPQTDRRLLRPPPGPHAPTRTASCTALTTREREVLTAIATGWSNAEIAEPLLPGRVHGQVPRRPHPRQDRGPGPGPGGDLRLRHGVGAAGLRTGAPQGLRSVRSRRQRPCQSPPPRPG